MEGGSERRPGVEGALRQARFCREAEFHGLGIAYHVLELQSSVPRADAPWPGEHQREPRAVGRPFECPGNRISPSSRACSQSEEAASTLDPPIPLQAPVPGGIRVAKGRPDDSKTYHARPRGGDEPTSNQKVHSGCAG